MVSLMQTIGTLDPAASREVGATTWDIDPAHSLVEFSVKHMMFTTVRGRFKKLRGTIQCPDESDPTRASVETEIDASSLQRPWQEPLRQRGGRLYGRNHSQP